MAQAARAAAFVLCVARTLSDGPSCAEEGHASWTRESWATARAAGLARPGAPFPVFLKFHKVGSATVSRVIRCAAISDPALVPDAWRRDRDNASAGCGPTAWEHETLALYSRHGADAVRACAARGVAPRLLALLRDPVERVLSAIYFFGGGGHLARRSPEAKRFHSGAPFALDELADLLAPDGLLSKAGGAHEYVDALAGVDARLRSEAGAVALARAALARDFDVVGVTEDMAGFLALVALELGWPRLLACYLDYHVNSRRPRRDTLGADVVDALERRLRDETAVHAHARELFAAHAARRGAEFAGARAELVGALNGTACGAAKRRQHCAVSELPDETVGMVVKRNCFSTVRGTRTAPTIGGVGARGRGARDLAPPGRS